MPLTDDATSPVAAVRPNPSSAVTAPLDTTIRTPRRPAPLAGDTEIPGVTAPASRDVAVVHDRPEKPEGVDEPVPANGAKAASDSDDAENEPGPPVLPNMHRVVWRTIVKSWDDGIIGWAAQAAFWQALSLPPLLLGLLGSVGYVAGWFGPGTVDIVYDRIIEFAQRTFTETVVDDLITPTVDSVLGRGRIGLMSVGFILSLWAGSSAMSCFIASIAKAHDQHEVRHPVWQRFFALFLYVGFLFVAVFLLPLVALGPNYLRAIVPESGGRS
ncbi:hypothetical protein GOALK_021_00050 [Gordonia alkanivorans NBRC 16433]|uniref:Uncharacterized protein n=1 Tax=Gordonia alkanivorans NBRC 16433 TaxID=1027371 RepID=F9VR58_9ACTN|nr:hypothetical protein GOALK_021_00050 [Gordonia alkanivorans NBRC 16433]